jgi:hypothetical protein
VPCISGSFNPRDGIYHPIAILPVPVPGLVDGTVQDQTIQIFKALFDTGAQVTCITERAASKVELPPRGRSRLVSASEVRETNVYLFHAAFVLPDHADQQGSFSGSMGVFGPFEGLEINAESDDDVDVLIGMNIIGRGSFHVGFHGVYTFCW